MSTDPLEANVSYLGDDDAEFFKTIHGRTLNTLNPRYMLPVDAEEVKVISLQFLRSPSAAKDALSTKRSELHHRMLQFVFGGQNYTGPVKQALQFGERRRILDLGTGGGFWAINMADDFPRAEVIGVDLAPIQPRSVPPYCTFELCDLDQWNIPYPDNHFDLIHARSVHTGIRNYPRLLEEIARILRPGGLVLIVEPSLMPMANGSAGGADLHGWFTVWETYRTCLKLQDINTTVPESLEQLLTSNGSFEKVDVRAIEIPVGFWPTDPHSLTIGQLQWMDFDMFLPALKPLFLSSGISEAKTERIIADAQRDLYNPSLSTSTQLHIAHASKCL